METTAIKDQRDYRRALKEIEGLMTARSSTPEGDRAYRGVGTQTLLAHPEK